MNSTGVEEWLGQGEAGRAIRQLSQLFWAGTGHLNQDKVVGRWQVAAFLVHLPPKHLNLMNPELSTASALQICFFPHVPIPKSGPTSLPVIQPETPEVS